jgi:hypothetical protein
MESVYHIVAIRVNETSWAHVWRLRFRYLGMGYDSRVLVQQQLPREFKNGTILGSLWATMSYTTQVD